VESDPLLAEDLSHVAAQYRAKAPHERCFERLYDRYLKLAFATAGRYLHPDESAPDHRHAGTLSKSLPEYPSVVEIPKQIDACTTGERRNAARHGPGGDDEPVVGNLIVAFQAHPLRSGIQADGWLPQTPVHFEVLGPLPAQGELLRLPLPLQELLGQGRAVIGLVRLLPHRNDAAAVAFPA